MTTTRNNHEEPQPQEQAIDKKQPRQTVPTTTTITPPKNNSCCASTRTNMTIVDKSTTTTTSTPTNNNDHHHYTNGGNSNSSHVIDEQHHQKHQNGSKKRRTIDVRRVQQAFIHDSEHQALVPGDSWYVLSMHWINKVWIEQCQDKISDDSDDKNDKVDVFVEWNESMRIDQSDLLLFPSSSNSSSLTSSSEQRNSPSPQNSPQNSDHFSCSGEQQQQAVYYPIVSTYVQKSIDVIVSSSSSSSKTDSDHHSDSNNVQKRPLLSPQYQSSCDSVVYSVQIRPNLQEEVDFRYVSRSCWQLLVQQFGIRGCLHDENDFDANDNDSDNHENNLLNDDIVDDHVNRDRLIVDRVSHVIERRVIVDGNERNRMNRIELYPYLLHLVRLDYSQQNQSQNQQQQLPTMDLDRMVHVLVSKKTLLCDLRCIGYWALELYLSESKKTRMAAENDLKDHLQRHVRMWNCLTMNNVTLIDNLKMNMTLEDALLVTDQRILFEIPVNDVWPLDRLYQQQLLSAQEVDQQQQQQQQQRQDQDIGASTSQDDLSSTKSSSTRKRKKLVLKLSVMVNEVKNKILDLTSSTPTGSTSNKVYTSNGKTHHHNSSQSSMMMATVDKSASTWKSKRGYCGLRNLGNTCFMNSALQCLSNTQPLNDYFLSGAYVDDINKVNPLGSKGKLAKEFATLMRDMWSGATVVAPISFKYAIGQFAPQFSGFAQHDAQELIAYLLDGLHEDLNRVKDKPFVELMEANGRPDEIVAQESWNHHLLRNQSIIVDLFQGQLKSTLTCPECNRISIKFDPFMYLSVPIPHTSTVIINVIMYDYGDMNATVGARPKKYCIEMSTNHTAGVLKQKFADEFNYDSTRLLFADMIGNKIDNIITDMTSVHYLNQKKQILCFHTPVRNDQKPYTRVRLTQMIKVTSQHPTGLQQYQSCCIPVFLFIHPGYTTRQIYEFVWVHVYRYLIPCKSSASSDCDDQNDSGENSSTETNSQTNNGEVHQHHPPKFDPMNRSFTILLTDTTGYKCSYILCPRPGACTGCELPCDDGMYRLMVDQTLTVVWNSETDVDQKESLTVNLDPSVSECRQRINRPITLEDCLTTFSEVEQLGPNDPWYCPHCKDLKQAYKKFEIWSAPDILCIHLKRFVYNRNFRERIDRYVDFPIERLDLSRFMVRHSKEPLLYDLYAISNHMGSLGGGHYVAHAKNRCDGNWYRFDDSSCTQVPSSTLVSSSAYLLFYQRRKKTGTSPDLSVNLELTSSVAASSASSFSSNNSTTPQTN